MPCQLCSQELLASKLVLLNVVLQISSTLIKFTVQFHPLQTAMENSSPSMKHWSSFQMVPVLNARFVGKFSATLVTAGSISRIFTIQDRWSAQYAKRFVVVLRSLEIILLIRIRFIMRKMWSRSMGKCLINCSGFPHYMPYFGGFLILLHQIAFLPQASHLSETHWSNFLTVAQLNALLAKKYSLP